LVHPTLAQPKAVAIRGTTRRAAKALFTPVFHRLLTHIDARRRAAVVLFATIFRRVPMPNVVTFGRLFRRAVPRDMAERSQLTTEAKPYLVLFFSRGVVF
jgi:hypothetical protein